MLRSHRNENTRAFYIHLPEQSNSQKQAIEPINGQGILRDILSGRTIREFPTIIVAVPGLDEIDLEKQRIEAPSLIEPSKPEETEIQRIKEESSPRKRKADEADEMAAEETQRLKVAAAAAQKDLAHIASMLQEV